MQLEGSDQGLYQAAKCWEATRSQSHVDTLSPLTPLQQALVFEMRLQRWGACKHVTMTEAFSAEALKPFRLPQSTGENDKACRGRFSIVAEGLGEHPYCAIATFNLQPS